MSLSNHERVEWLDYAKGWCIILVVAMHSALGVGAAVENNGWLHPVVAFAKPFRMPDFFLIAGIFVGRSLSWPWPRFIDRKAIRYFYFYALWVAIILFAKWLGRGDESFDRLLLSYLWSFIEPFSSMWFILLLPFLFLFARFTRHWSAALTLGLTGCLHCAAAFYPVGGDFAMASDMTASMLINSFCLFAVFFMAGHYGRALIFRFANKAADYPVSALAVFGLWACFNQFGVSQDYAGIPGLTIVYGLAGALAVVTLASLMAKWRLSPWLAYCGRHSLVIYLGFALPMAFTRILLIKGDMMGEVGFASLIVTIVAITAPLALERLVRGGRLSFLFDRPAWAHLR